MNSADVVGWKWHKDGQEELHCLSCGKFKVDEDEIITLFLDDVVDQTCSECWEFIVAPDPSVYTNKYIEAALRGSLECAAWSEDAPDLPWDKDSVDSARKELADFWITCRLFLGHWPASQMGHDFWLTRNGHGTGFWDRGFPEGNLLTELCEPYGSAYVEVWDNGDENVLAIF